MTPPFIYALIDPIEPHHVRYIGMTMTARRRPYYHLWAAQHDPAGTHAFRWIRKMLAEGRKYTVLILEELHADSSLEDVCDAERDYISAARAQGHPLTNDNAGGLGSSQPSAETREKHRINGLGNKYAAGGKSRTGHEHPIAARIKMQDAWTPERRAAQAERNREMARWTTEEKLKRAEVAIVVAKRRLAKSEALKAKTT